MSVQDKIEVSLAFKDALYTFWQVQNYTEWRTGLIQKTSFLEQNICSQSNLYSVLINDLAFACSSQFESCLSLLSIHIFLTLWGQQQNLIVCKSESMSSTPKYHFACKMKTNWGAILLLKRRKTTWGELHGSMLTGCVIHCLASYVKNFPC